MSRSHLFMNVMPPTPRLIKYLVLISLAVGCLSGFFHSMLGAHLGIRFLDLFSLNIFSFVKGYIWQPFTFLFLPQIEGSLSFYFLFSLSFDLYLLWIVGCKVHQIFGPKTTMKLFYVPAILGCALASLIGHLFHFSMPLYGLSYAMIPLVTAFCFSHTDSSVRFLPMQSVQIRWISVGLVLLYLLQDLSTLNFTSLLAHLLIAFFTYIHLLYFHGLRSPFSFTNRLDDFILSFKKKPTSSKVVYLYDQHPPKETAIDRTFNKIKNNQKLSVLDKIRLKRYYRKSQSESKE